MYGSKYAAQSVQYTMFGKTFFKNKMLSLQYLAQCSKKKSFTDVCLTSHVWLKMSGMKC